MNGTFGERIFRWMDDHFVGREFELAVFRQWLEHLEAREERILNVYGTAGMGKTYLLDRFAGIARECGASYVSADARDALGRKERLLAGWLEAMGEGVASGDADDPYALQERCLRLLNERSAASRAVLALDGYEEIGALDHWLRTSFLPQLGGNVLVVVAGRFPLEGPWRHSPAWRRLIVRLPLAELSYEEIGDYARKWGIEDERTADEIWLRTMGHPLALSLLTPAGDGPSFTEEEEPLKALLDAWLREAPDDELRGLLFAAAAVRTFHRDLLAKLMDRDVPDPPFQRLTELSFVARAARGWQLHELVWETLRRHGRERMPETFAAFRKRAIEYYVGKLEEGLERGRDVAPEFAELLRYADNAVLRAHYRHARASRNYTEPLQDANRAEALAYARRRLQEEEARRVRCADPESGEAYRFELAPEIGGARLALVPPEELLALGEDSVRLLRNPEGQVAGLFVIVPVNGRTYDWLAKAPVSRAFLASLPEAERSRLKGLPPGQADTRYVYALDVEDLEREELRSDLVGALLEPLLDGCLLAESPPPHPYYRLGKASLGFEPLAGAEHFDYGGEEPAPTFALDTRRDKLRVLLDRMLGSASPAGIRVSPSASGRANPPPLTPAGSPTATAPAQSLPLSASPRTSPSSAVPPPIAPPSPIVAAPGALSGLTPREREVAERLALGWTNAEIAAALFVSEAAVKKHVNGMLSKFGLRNRTELAKLLLNSQ